MDMEGTHGLASQDVGGRILNELQDKCFQMSQG